MKFFIALFACTVSLALQAHEYFPTNYEDSRQKFRSMATRWQSQSSTGHLRVPSTKDSDLTIDHFYWRGPQAKSLVILSSGVHGVEAFAGAAVQTLFFRKILPQFAERDDISFLLVHSINPYGFKYLRRVSENNIDLNRNFGTSQKLFTLKNPGYSAVRELLNPVRPVNLSSFSYYFSFVEMIWQILSKGMKPLRQAVLQGQYEFPKGLYFGGENHEPQAHLLGPFLKEKLAPYQNILAIDLHTGYGEKNKLHLFGPTGLNPIEKSTLDQIFLNHKIDTGDDDDFYEVHGDFTQFIAAQAPENSVFIPMTFEYGTLDSQTSIGALKSISNMILENQGHHHGYHSDSDKARVRERIQDMYYPADKTWRTQVVEQAEDLLPQAIRNFLELELEI